MIKICFNAAGRPTNLTTEHADDTVKDMLDYFDANEYNSELIRAANTLPDIERCILVMYVRNNLNLTKTAKQLHSSTQYLKKRLEEIIEQVKVAIDPEYLDEELEHIHEI